MAFQVKIADLLAGLVNLKDKIGQLVVLGGATTSSGADAGLMVLGDKVDLGTGQSGEFITSVLIGTPNTKVNLPSGSGLGPDTFVVDLSKFSASDIRLVVLTSSANHSAIVQFSNSGASADVHPATADSLLSAASGNADAVIIRKDNFAHITLSQSGTAQPVYAYVVGREMA